MVGTSDGHRKFHLSSNQGFSGIRMIFFRISDIVSELLMNIGSFGLLPTEGSRETVSGQTGLAYNSSPEHSKVRNDAMCWQPKLAKCAADRSGRPVRLVWSCVIRIRLDLIVESVCNLIWKGYVLPGL